MIHHHLPDELLIEYVSGASDEAVALVVATHLALCPACRERERTVEALGGLALERAEECALGEGSVEALMSRLDEEEAPAPAPPSHDADWLALGVPQPLRSRLGPLRWKTSIPGRVHRVDLDVDFAGTPVSLFRLQPGFRVPVHGHDGLELNLVLSGGFHDAGVGYARGDLSVRDETHEHDIKVDPGEPCMVLVVREGELRPKGLAAALFSRLIRT